MAKKALLGEAEDIDERTNSGRVEPCIMVPVADINLDPTFEGLFRLDQNTVDEIAEDILQNGYDNSQPVHVWREKGILIDGHTRFAAAKQAGCMELPVFYHSFETEAEAKLYALGLQLKRRNLSGPEFLRVCEEYNSLGGHKNIKELRQQIAAATGMSRSTITQALTVMKDADGELKEAVESGEKTINQAYNEIMSAKHPKEDEDSEPESSGDTVEDDFLRYASMNSSQEPEEPEKKEEEQDEEVEKDSISDREREYSGTEQQKTGNVVAAVPLEREEIGSTRTTGAKNGNGWEENNYVRASNMERGFAEGFQTAFFYVLAEIRRQTTVDEILAWFDGESLSADGLKKFQMPDYLEPIIKEMKKDMGLLK